MIAAGSWRATTAAVFAALAAAWTGEGRHLRRVPQGRSDRGRVGRLQISSNGKQAKGIGGSFAAADASGCNRDSDRGESYSDNGKAPIKDNGFKEKLDIFPTSKRANAVGTSKIVVEFKGNGDGKGTVNVNYTDPEACDYKDKFVAHAFE